MFAFHVFVLFDGMHLDSSVVPKDSNLSKLQFLQSTPPNNINCVGACVYNKSCHPLKAVPNTKTIIVIIKVRQKVDNICTFILLYRSPCQNIGSSENVIENLG